MFGLSSNRSKSVQTSQSDAYGYSLSGGSSVSDSLSTSRARSGGSSSQRIAFEDLFQSLYSGAFGATSKAAGELPMIEEAARGLFSGGMDFLGTLQGGAGTDYLEERLGQGDELLDESIGGLQADIGRLFREELNPAITDRAVGTGTLGGGRQGVAQTGAARVAAEQFRKGATELRLADRASRDQAAGTLAGLQTGAATAGLASLPGLVDLAGAGAGLELGLYERLAALMGGPTSLTESSQFGESDSEAIARALSEQFGLSEDTASSRSYGESSARGWGLSFGAGGK